MTTPHVCSSSGRAPLRPAGGLHVLLQRLKDEIGDICLESDIGSRFKERLIHPAAKCAGASGEEECIVAAPAALHSSTSRRKPSSGLSTVIVQCISINTTKNVSVCLAPVIASSRGTSVTVPRTPSALTPQKYQSLQLRDGEASHSIKWHKMSMIIADHSEKASSRPI